METKEIRHILENHSRVVFGPRNSKNGNGNYIGMPYLTVDVKEKTIKFTSDTMDYAMNKKLEEAMEKLFTRFGVIDYKVQIHIHKGDWHDKDITLQLKDIEGVQDSKDMPEIIKFVQDNFYKNHDEWDFAPESSWQSNYSK